MLRLTSAALCTLLLSASLHAQDWKLVWSDEFDKPGLPDPAKWDYETGFVRNNEAQYYTRDRKENARVENGVLVIEGIKERFKNPRHNPASSRSREYAEYTSASLHTLGKASWLYGRIEVKAKLPQGKGTWPAIWMMGTNRPQVGWARCGEIDIMEFVGHTPGVIHANVHYHTDKKRSAGNKVKTPLKLDDFNIYAVEWFPDRMDFYFNDQKYFTFPIDQANTGAENAFRKPQYLILNLALGGSWGKEIDDTLFPHRYEIDYVRVYQKP